MLLAALGLLLVAQPMDDSVLVYLDSPVYAERQKARDYLRSTFVPSDRKRWDNLQALLIESEGKPISVVKDEVYQKSGSQIDIVREGEFSFSRTELDNDWVLYCTFYNNLLADVHLRLEPPTITPDPPPGYTGIWRVYREDGSIASDYYYSHGKRCGPLGDDSPSSFPPVEQNIELHTSP